MSPDYLSPEEMSVFTAYKRVSSGKEAIFIHIPKTAGSSIRQTLGFNEPIHSNKRFQKHYKFIEVEEYLEPACIDRALSFAVVRNPWDRLYSAFLYRRRQVLAKAPEEVSPRVINGIQNFGDWGRFLLGRKKPVGGVLTIPQIDWIKNTKGEIAVDYLGKYENLEADYANICNKLGIQIKTLRKENVSKRKRDYRPVYNDFLRGFVEEYYKEDIETFDYRF